MVSPITANYLSSKIRMHFTHRNVSTQNSEEILTYVNTGLNLPSTFKIDNAMRMTSMNTSKARQHPSEKLLLPMRSNNRRAEDAILFKFPAVCSTSSSKSSNKRVCKSNSSPTAMAICLVLVT
jgi:paraquat-inducible protein B